MPISLETPKTSRPSRINLTIRQDLMKDATRLGIDPTQAAETGILEAIREAKRDVWRSENKTAIEAYNTEIRERGIALPAIWGAIGA